MNRVRLWARVGMEFYIDESDLYKVNKAIKTKQYHIADSILQKALSDTGKMNGEAYIPDCEEATSGVNMLEDYTFQDIDV